MPKPFERSRREVRTGTFKTTDRVRQLVNEVLDSERISYGDKSMRFERWFAELHDCKYAVLSNSGTSSLHIALQALKELHGWPDGSLVIVPASTFVATINVVLHNNLDPLFVDIEPLTYGLDPECVKAAIENVGADEIVAMIPVHLYGQPCLMTELMAIAALHDIKVIEDSCESMFVSCYGQKVGSMGDIGCFSTYNAHLITTGVGGLGTTNNPSYAMKMRSLVNHGLDITELNTDECFSPRPNIGRSFRFTHAGHSYRITELEAAIGIAQLEDHKSMLKARRRNAKHYGAKFRLLNEHRETNLFLPSVAAGNEHAWMMYPIVLDPKRMPKEKLLPYLNEQGIETRDMMPIIRQPIYADIIDPQHFPTAQWVDDNGFYIGCHQDLEPDDVEYVAQCFERFLHET